MNNYVATHRNVREKTQNIRGNPESTNYQAQAKAKRGVANHNGTVTRFVIG